MLNYKGGTEMETNELNELKRQEEKVRRMLVFNIKQEYELLELRKKLAPIYFRLMDFNIKSGDIIFNPNTKDHILINDEISNINEMRGHISVLEIIGEKIIRSIEMAINVNYKHLHDLFKEIKELICELEQNN